MGNFSKIVLGELDDDWDLDFGVVGFMAIPFDRTHLFSNHVGSWSVTAVDIA